MKTRKSISDELSVCKCTVNISVGELVCFLLRSGDIGGRGIYTSDRLKEGKDVHSRFESDMISENENYRAEVRLESKFVLADNCIEFVVSGIADGISLNNGEYTVDEIKSVKGTAENVPYNPLHLAQAKCYAFMLCVSRKLSRCNIRLCYVPVNSGEIVYRESVNEFTELNEFFNTLIKAYLPFALIAAKRYINPELNNKTIKFPYDKYRDGQKELIREIYKAGKNKYKLFASAPTGIGKTISALYPAIKLLLAGKTDKIFYLTPRSSIRAAAMDALNALQNGKPLLKSITLASKHDLCPFDECTPELCEKAAGHYSRINEALLNLLNQNTHISEKDIGFFADKYKVCPFELALDASEYCDIVICDYNYIFDPFVSIKRYALNTDNYFLLIDEAHNLPDRVRECWSARLDESDISSFYKAISNKFKQEAEITSDLLNYFKIAAKAVKEENKLFSFELEDEPVIYAYKLSELLLKRLITLNPEDDTLPYPYEKIKDLYFKYKRFCFIADIAKTVRNLDSKSSNRLISSYIRTYMTLYDTDGSLKIYLIDPSERISSIVLQWGNAVFFSATLLPSEYYFNVLGGNDFDNFIDLPSPYARENRLIADIEIETTYSARNSTVVDLCRYINAAVNVKHGNYLVFMPSFDYLENAVSVYKRLFSYDKIIVQKRHMPNSERESFVSSFRQIALGNISMVGFAVLGGIFSEGIDLIGDALYGAIIVGVGLVPPNKEKESQVLLYDERGETGKRLAYDLPGLNRVFQAAGRVIRSEDDRGFILLCDSRYRQQDYIEAFPDDWDDIKHIADIDDLKDALNEFWE
ncbi:MAG: ATP-dependent DNA helicase [Oscillospiraceae bacterium]|nr:ATP-dependent DNA helicase [Oscillospiraceae bacterium]